MKKHTCVLVLAAVLLFAGSCEKSYTCQCTLPNTTQKENRTTKAKNRARAEEACTYQYHDFDIDHPYDCHLL